MDRRAEMPRKCVPAALPKSLGSGAVRRLRHLGCRNRRPQRRVQCQHAEVTMSTFPWWLDQSQLVAQFEQGQDKITASVRQQLGRMVDESIQVQLLQSFTSKLRPRAGRCARRCSGPRQRAQGSSAVASGTTALTAAPANTG